LLAAFLLFHLAAVTLRALPAPDGALDRAAWSDPTVQKELSAWHQRLAGFGLRQSPAEFADSLYRLASRALTLRNRLVAPFARYYAACGTYQSWQMFVAPHRHPARLRIDIQQAGAWHTVFREGDANASWLSTQLGDTRFRSLLFRFGWPGYRGQLDHFADWVAHRAAVAFPQASACRVVLSRADTPTPEQARAGIAPESTEDPPRVRELGPLRRDAAREPAR